MANNIQAIFDNRWNGGYNAGWNAGVAHISTNNNTVSFFNIGMNYGNHGGNWATSDANVIVIMLTAEASTAYSTSVSNAVKIYEWPASNEFYIIAWKTTSRGLSHAISVWIDRSGAGACIYGIRY